MKTFAAVSCLALAAGFAPSARGNYTESLNGEISGDRFAPTVITLNTGDNVISGTFGISPVPAPLEVADLDYFQVTIPAGAESRILLLSLNAGGSNSFLGVSAGPVFLIPFDSRDPTPLLAWNHIFANQHDTNLVPFLGLGTALSPGTYTFWINETDTTQPWTYSLNFQLSPVPEPASLILLAPALAMLATRRRRAL